MQGKKEAGMASKVTFEQLIDMMIGADLELAKKGKTLLDAGYENVKNHIR